MAFLCISLDNSSVNVVHILDGELSDIDKYTLRYNGAKPILKEFPEKIEELKNRYELKNVDSSIKVRIFLPNDKEQFILYHKHLITFKYVIKDRKFLKYAVSYENIFNRNINDMIEDDTVPNNLVYSEVYNYIKSLDESDYYKLIRNICDQYMNYIEDNEDEDILTIDEIYQKYIDNKQDSISSTTTTEISPFAVFEHPNFSRLYGPFIDKEKPIFILGDIMNEETKIEYKEIYENTKKCFTNLIYYPFNANVSAPLDDEFKRIYSNSLVVIVVANGYSQDLYEKINYASAKGITVLILVNDSDLEKIYKERFFEQEETVIIKNYIYDDFKSKKMFADIMVGLYINAYKNKK